MIVAIIIMLIIIYSLTPCSEVVKWDNAFNNFILESTGACKAR